LLVIVDYPEVMAFCFWLLIEEQLALEGLPCVIKTALGFVSLLRLRRN
jgi:hypothetical protein